MVRGSPNDERRTPHRFCETNRIRPPADPPLRTDSAKRTGMVRVHRTTNEQRRTTNAPPILPNEPEWSAFTERRTNNDERRTPSGSLLVTRYRAARSRCLEKV